MSLKETLLDDLKSAMKEKNVPKKNAIQMARASVLQFEKDNKTTLDDEGIIEIIAKEVKKRKDVLPDYEKCGREDLLNEINTEIETLMVYLPAQLSDDEIDELVKKVIADASASSMKDMGKVMAALMPLTKGKADGKRVNLSVKKFLS